MIRNVLLASVLSLVGCLDQGQPAVGTTDQDSTITTVRPTAPTYSNVVPVWWSARYTAQSDYWDFGIPGAGTTVNLQMTAFIVNGEAATLDANGRVTDPATRFVWLISNTGVYKVYEVYVGDIAQMKQIMGSVFTNVENNYAASGYQAPGSSIIVGVDGGVSGGGKKGGGPPHGFPTAVVQQMINVNHTTTGVIIAIPQIGAGSLI